ncbi:host cell attachment protein [Aurantimonas aggregata]|uniref:Host cell attachment protein n=1 Tax=Aurantimonas aggregata TaxID=2047720 RepID=A0A6L9MC55_9HYPH|nr:host attachment protein [Aurantimonas aggregata]NDV85250.1 host cell attachment protein [Aurantimonas aggregata]
MILANGTIVAVVDGKNLKLFHNKGTETQLDLAPMADPTIDASNAGSGGRHQSSSANPDSHRGDEDAFAAASAEHLNQMALKNKLEHVFIIADPRTLGEMRKHYHANLKGKIVGDLAKDLTGHSVDDIAAAVQKA